MIHFLKCSPGFCMAAVIRDGLQQRVTRQPPRLGQQRSRARRFLQAETPDVESRFTAAARLDGPSVQLLTFLSKMTTPRPSACRRIRLDSRPFFLMLEGRQTVEVTDLPRVLSLDVVFMEPFGPFVLQSRFLAVECFQS